MSRSITKGPYVDEKLLKKKILSIAREELEEKSTKIIAEARKKNVPLCV